MSPPERKPRLGPYSKRGLTCFFGLRFVAREGLPVPYPCLPRSQGSLVGTVTSVPQHSSPHVTSRERARRQCLNQSLEARPYQHIYDELYKHHILHVLPTNTHPRHHRHPAASMALDSFFHNKIESMKLEIIQGQAVLRRLEAQRNDYNSRGSTNFIYP
jgi:hypothetical protein